jgi:hypothetical protein
MKTLEMQRNNCLIRGNRRVKVNYVAANWTSVMVQLIISSTTCCSSTKCPQGGCLDTDSRTEWKTRERLQETFATIHIYHRQNPLELTFLRSTKPQVQCSGCSSLGCDTVTCRWIPTFRSNTSPKHRYPPTSQVVTIQNITIWLLVAEKKPEIFTATSFLLKKFTKTTGWWNYQDWLACGGMIFIPRFMKYRELMSNRPVDEIWVFWVLRLRFVGCGAV